MIAPADEPRRELLFGANDRAISNGNEPGRWCAIGLAVRPRCCRLRIHRSNGRWALAMRHDHRETATAHIARRIGRGNDDEVNSPVPISLALLAEPER